VDDRVISGGLYPLAYIIGRDYRIYSRHHCINLTMRLWHIQASNQSFEWLRVFTLYCSWRICDICPLTCLNPHFPVILSILTMHLPCVWLQVIL